MATQVKFCGAAGMVTGSCYLLTTPGGKFLVDCGMFQGIKTVRELNYNEFAFDVNDIDAVLLTHAHIDHSGLIPKLYRNGYEGPVYCTEGTRDLLTIMLPDSGHIQEHEVKYLNRHNERRGLPTVDPIYGQKDAYATLDILQTVEMDAWVDVLPGVRARYWNAGHILGSASIEVEVTDPDAEEGKLTFLFSGDIGPNEKAFHPDPQAPSGIDYLFTESTYGDRDRDDASMENRRDALKKEIHLAMKAGGNLIIPVFAIERTQELLLDLNRLIEDKQVPRVKVFLDSPLAQKATDIFRMHMPDLEDVDGGMRPFNAEYLTFTRDVAESKAINTIHSGAIIMAASGMCDAGRIRHHLKNNLWNPAATVLFVGYQAPGSLGRAILDGRRTVRIHGQEIQVRANIRRIDTYSAHADRTELIDWVKARMPVRKGVFLVHGENESRHGMRDGLIEAGLEKDKVLIPALDDVYDLAADGAPVKLAGDARIAPEEAEAPMDWHNEYAEVLLELAEELRGLPTREMRHELLQQVRSTIKAKKREAA